MSAPPPPVDNDPAIQAWLDAGAILPPDPHRCTATPCFHDRMPWIPRSDYFVPSVQRNVKAVLDFFVSGGSTCPGSPSTSVAAI